MYLNFYQFRYATRKAAEEATVRANRGHGNSKVISNHAHGAFRMNLGKPSDEEKKEHHNKNYKGEKSSHFHPTDEDGKKVWGYHFLHPK